MEGSWKGIHWSKGLQRPPIPPPPPGATQPISTVSIFYECFWRKSGRWGTAPNTTPVNKEAGKERSHRWDGRSVLLLHYRLVFVFIICLLKMLLCNPPRTNAWSETRSKIRQLWKKNKTKTRGWLVAFPQLQHFSHAATRGWPSQARI